ncbi:ATP-binding protein [Agreia pratensis]|uniref:AAA family ATPase n=1 Tax=Agreia pratensis TaxID=150121 RepID=UPI00188B648A|nr:ATP-binding protein [Agreia pratensis]MBF4636214.1 ATP-binding protein [Agreia pratensis]
MTNESHLLAFKLQNFRSFRDAHVLKFTRYSKDLELGFKHPDIAPALAVLGANASGKSNLLRGLTVMFSMIEGSAVRGAGNLPYSPFVFGGEDLGPTYFEAVVRFDGVRYDYSFSYDAEAIIEERLFSYPKNRPRLLFDRDGAGEEDEWTFGDSMTGPSQSLAKATRRRSLLLSTAQLLNHDVLTPLFEKFAALVKSIDSDKMAETLQSTLEDLSKDQSLASSVTALLKEADLGISGLSIEKTELSGDSLKQMRRVYELVYPDSSPEDIDDKIKRMALLPQLKHTRGQGKPIALPFNWESLGTRNFLTLLGPVLRLLRSGGVLVVDELDTSLHPRLVSQVVRLFQSEKTNPHQAQLLISTHDVTVMMNTGDYSALRRDQVWFVQKDDDGGSTLTALADYKPRKDEVFSRSYLNGRYGAIPRIDDDAFLRPLSDLEQ